MRKGITYAIGLGVILLAIPLAVMAMWSETLRMDVQVGTGEVDWGFDASSLIYLDGCGLPSSGEWCPGVSCGWDWNRSGQMDKDVGCTDVHMIDTDGDGDYDALNVTLYNIYPYYYTHIAFKVCNTGTVPVKIWKIELDNKTYYAINEQELENGDPVDLSGDGQADVIVWWGDNFGVQLEPGQCADISFDISVTQEAPQGSALSLLIKLFAIQWNEYEEQVPQD